MAFFSVLFALVIEQFRALGRDNPVHQLVRFWVGRIEHAFDAGKPGHAILAWCVVVLPCLLIVMIVYVLLLKTSLLLALGWNVMMVYLTLGFRQFSHYFTDIHKALSVENVAQARTILQAWSGQDTQEMPQPDVVRVTLERAILGAHRHVFGVFFWFLLPIGPAGVVLYRMAEYLARHWSQPMPDRSEALGLYARKAFYIIDWLPTRLTALGFAIVGNFEDAVYAWRNFANQWSEESEGILLASGGGALGVRLGEPMAEPSSEAVLSADALLLPIGEESSVRTLQSAVGLVWRAVVLWMLLLAMLSLATWLG